MRKLAFVTVASASLALLALTAPAQAQSRALQIEVKPRSWLDAGKVVNVGSMQNYMYDTQGPTTIGGGRSAGLLPDRFSGGRPIVVDIPAPEFLRR